MFNVIGRRRKDTVCFSSYNSLFLWIYTFIKHYTSQQNIEHRFSDFWIF